MGKVEMAGSVLRIAVVGLAGLAGFAAPAAGSGQTLAMLDEIAGGRWELRVREPGVAPQQMCVSSGRRFIQLRHQADSCASLIIEDGQSDVTVQYSCRGRGYGRTHIRKESARLLQIDSQGIAEGLPFQFTAEARRTGDCGG